MNSTLRLHRALARKGVRHPLPLHAPEHQATRGPQRPAPFDVAFHSDQGYVLVHPLARNERRR